MNAHAYAKQLDSAFEIRTRDDKSEFYALKDGSPEWVKEVCHAAHMDGSEGGMLPDDWRYAFIAQAASLLADTPEDEWDDIEVEPDVYTSHLTSWLASRNDRQSYCDEYFDDFGMSNDGEIGLTFKLLSGGQYMEKREVLNLVRRALEEKSEG